MGMFQNAKSFTQILCGAAWVDSKASKYGMFQGSSGYISPSCTPTTTTTTTTTADPSAIPTIPPVPAALTPNTAEEAEEAEEAAAMASEGVRAGVISAMVMLCACLQA